MLQINSFALKYIISDWQVSFKYYKEIIRFKAA